MTGVSAGHPLCFHIRVVHARVKKIYDEIQKTGYLGTPPA
jgi:hypothetical protein